jgi:ferritin-like metal-binding protein YciE
MKDNLNDLYLDELQDLYSAEEQLIEALPKVIKMSTDVELTKALERHLEETKGHRQKVADILESHDKKPGEVTCLAMKGLIKEAENHLKKKVSDEVCNAMIIAASQRIEHYEIAGYGTVEHYAERLGHSSDARKLQSILKEEYNADQTLNKIAKDHVNDEAMAGAEKE